MTHTEEQLQHSRPVGLRMPIDMYQMCEAEAAGLGCSTAAVALLTSIRVVAANPVTMALWGLIVTALLVIGLVPFFLGLTVVFPVLGHATWHLYRKAVEPNPDPHPDYQPRQKNDRSAADFPAVLFPTRR